MRKKYNKRNFKSRTGISKRYSKRNFKTSARRTHKKNLPKRARRGGYRL